MNKPQVMEKFGFKDSEEFDALLLDLGIDPELQELTEKQVESVKNHVTVFASSLAGLPAPKPQTENTNVNGSYLAPDGAMTVVTNQGLQIAKEAGLEISRGALETLSQMTFDKGRLDAAFLENAYWLGLLRQQNQLRTANVEKFIQLYLVQQNTNVDLEKLATDAGLLSHEELVKKLSAAAAGANPTNLTNAVAAATAW
ncbi:MAG TPA: hypothetical protein V6D11_11360 [Waterburya sp.]|jgi:hypothetical protein